MKNAVETIDEIGELLGRIHRLDAFLRNGQFLNAHREANHILSDIGDDERHSELRMRLKRLVGFISNIVNAHSELSGAKDALQSQRAAILKEVTAHG